MELLRQGLETKQIIDTDHVLQKAILEVDSLKASLLQANNDAMRLAGRILQQFDHHQQQHQSQGKLYGNKTL